MRRISGLLYRNRICRNLLNRLIYGERVYTPKYFETPTQILNTNPSAWKGLELIIGDIIKFSKISTKTCLEFGVEYGFSTSVFSNYFEDVTGVDIFSGDIHTGTYSDIYQGVKISLDSFKNVSLIKADYKEFIKKPSKSFYDLIHVDIVHTYDATFECGLWSAQHSNCTLFHDTESFPDVKKAVASIASKTGKKFYNYKECNGLGILI